VTTRNTVIALLMACAALTGCGPSEAELIPTFNPDVIRTEAVATFSSGLTQTALAAPTITSTPTLLPTNTLLPTGTAGTAKPQSSCYNLLYIKDVTVPDNTVMPPGLSFTKTWEVQNSGSCAWAPGFTFSLVGGDAMGGQALKLEQPVQVGSVTQLSVAMVAPAGKTGTVQATWRMADATGAYFGNALTVVILVGGTTTGTAGTPAAATATPTLTPIPTDTTAP
jgi:hypothetical protein